MAMFREKYNCSEAMFSYIASTMVSLVSEMLHVNEDHVVELASQLKTFQLHKQPFEMVYQLTFSNYTRFVTLVPKDYHVNNWIEYVKGVFKKCKIQVTLRNGGTMEIGIITGNSYKHKKRSIIHDVQSLGGIMFDILHNNDKWKTYESLFSVDRYQVLSRVMWGVDFQGSLLNLLDLEGTWEKSLGLSPPLQHFVYIHIVFSSFVV